jgi:hypothetical protein
MPIDSNLSNSSIDFSNSGNSVSKDSSAFKKIQRFSKITTNNTSRNITSNLNNLKRIENLYLNNSTLTTNSYNYGNSNQHAYASLNTVLPYSTTLLDTNSLSKFFEYSLSQDENNFLQKSLNINYSIKGQNFGSTLLRNLHINSYLDLFFLRKLFFIINEPSLNLFSNNKDKSNLFNFFNKTEIYVKGNKLGHTPLHKSILDELITENRNTYYSWNLFNNSRSYKTKDLVSSNLKFLSPDKSSRLFINSKLNDTNLDFNVLESSNLMRKNIFNLSTDLSYIHNNSVNY